MIRRNILIFALGLICIITFPTSQAVGNTKFREAFAWRELTFNWPNDATRDQEISTGNYVPENNLPLGLAVWKDKVFVTVPRWKSGVPSSLNYIKKDGPVDQPLIPYPDWTTNRLVTESDLALDANVTKSRIVSTFRVWPDACDRLWLVDSGLADILGTGGKAGGDKPQAPEPPKIMVFDLKTDKLLLSYDLKKSDLKEDSFFANIIVDVDPNKCEDAFAYIPDLGGYGVVVYDWRQGESWRIAHHYFHMDPLAGDYNVGNVQFHWTDGIFSLALGTRDETGYRPIYFHPLSSTNEFVVNSKILQNKTLADESFDQYKLLGTRGPKTQATASVFHEKSGILFYTQINRNGVGCWNSKEEFNPSTQGIVTSDPETFVFPNDLKIDSEDNIWVLTDKLPVYVYKSLSSNDINYRILTAPVEKAVKDTIC